MIFVRICLISVIVLLAGQATAAQLTLEEIINAAISRDPGLQLNRLDTAITDADHQRIEGLLDPVVAASLSGSREQTPVASDFQAVTTRSAVASASISKPLANGGTLAVDFNHSRTGQDFVSPLAAQLARFNPAYRNQLDVSYRHPLLRGADRPAYHMAIIANDASTHAASLQSRITAHALALQAINRYFQLASDDINIDIAAQAVKRARQLLQYQRKREQFGLIERADRLQAEALLAARHTDLQQAKATRASDQSLLNRLMQRNPDTGIQIYIDDAPLPKPAAFTDMLKTAEQQRPELAALAAQAQAAKAQLQIASDTDQSQLDVIAKFGTRSLNSNAGTAAAQGLSIHDNFASLSLEYSDTLGRNNNRAAIRKAELAEQRIIAERHRTLSLISDQLAAASTALTTGQPTLQMARKQAQAEASQYNAEMKRYLEGRSDTATIIQFEADLRSAQLRAELQQLSLQLAAKQLAWAEGSFPAKPGEPDLNQPFNDRGEAWKN